MKLAEGKVLKDLTDSELITVLISEKLDLGLSVKESLKNVVEQKILGTYNIAVMEMKNP